jgi:hypothetical protein
VADDDDALDDADVLDDEGDLYDQLDQEQLHRETGM